MLYKKYRVISFARRTNNCTVQTAEPLNSSTIEIIMGINS